MTGFHPLEGGACERVRLVAYIVNLREHVQGCEGGFLKAYDTWGRHDAPSQCTQIVKFFIYWASISEQGMLVMATLEFPFLTQLSSIITTVLYSTVLYCLGEETTLRGRRNADNPGGDAAPSSCDIWLLIPFIFLL